MDKQFKVSREILFFSFRYALSRSSMSGSITIDNIKSNINIISTGDIQAYIKEINSCEYFGMDMDKRSWMYFVEYLENELEVREHNKLRLD